VALQFLFGEVLLSPMKIAISLAVAVYSSWQLSILCLVGMPVVALIVKHFGRRVYRHTRKSLKQLADLTDAMNQMFSGIYVVKAFQMEGTEVSEFKRSNAEQLRQMCRLVKNRALASGIPEAMYVVGTAVFFIVGNRLMLRGDLDVGRLATFAAAMVFMSQPLRTLSKGYSRLQEALAASDRLFELYELPVDSPDAPDAVELKGVTEGVNFRQVTFSYEPGQPVLRDVSFFAPAGSVIAVVGETGSGKSTLLNLIPRFHEPDGGAVEIDGVDVRQMRRESLLSQIAIVSQHPFLFNRSIGENIGYGRPGATEAQIEEAARLAGIHEHVASLPEGYRMPAGERGGFLSGGQRQCITIARAILKDAPLLILDEATSSLDSASEELVQEAFGNLMRGRTTFVIAHRLSTVRNADMIVVLRRGRVVEVGSHEELLAREGEYHRLYMIQFQDRASDE
jgi:subfamily B ATP-binding cassette protein MsbA